MGRIYEHVPAAWASHNENGTYPSSKMGKRVSFSGTAYTSYHTVVARYHDGPCGKFVLMTNNKYSVSTGSHKTAARQSANVPVFEVPYIGAWGGWSRETPMTDKERHVANLSYLWGLVDVQAMIRRWRSMMGDTWFREHNLGSLGRAWDNCLHYAWMADIEFTPPIPRERCIEWARVEIEARIEAWNDPVAVAKRERARALRLAKNVLITS
jgi:hypothetical protein